MSPRPSVEGERRRQILEAACEAIADRGFAAVRISDVAARADTSTGTVHYYFDSKQDVLHQALRFAFDQSIARQTRELSSFKSARDKLVQIIDLNLPEEPEVVQEWTMWMEFWIEALHHPELRPVNEELYGLWRTMVADVISEGQAGGEFDPIADAHDMANRFVALMDGLAIQVLLHSKKMPAGEMRRLCIDFVDRHLAPPLLAAAAEDP
jgi:AcrR family transcriptional regulator